jgi:hypothetical protein
MHQKTDLLAFSIMLLAIALLVWTAVAGPILEAAPAETSWLYRWKELVGNAIGAAGTVFAGWLAWRAVHKEIKIAAEERRERQVEAREVIVFAAAKIVHAAAAALSACRYASKYPVGSGPFETVAEKMSLLELLMKTTSARSLAAELAPGDRVLAITVLESADAAVAVWQTTKAENNAFHVKYWMKQLEGFGKALREFDGELHDVFEAGSKSA